MEYLVMECGRGYAVVLDREGHFLKVPDLGYEIGQVLDHVVIFDPPSTNKVYKKRFTRWIAMAASMCLLIIGGLAWQAPAGTVRMQINPDIRMRVNHFGRVVGLDGLNEDGRDLIEGYHAYGKTAKAVSYGLADHAMEMGYLSDGGQITLTVESKKPEWKTATEEMLLSELEIHFNHRITVTTISAGSSDESDDPPDPTLVDPGKSFPRERDAGSVEQENKDLRQGGNENMDNGPDEDMDNGPDEDIDNGLDEDMDNGPDEDIDNGLDEDMDNGSDEDSGDDDDGWKGQNAGPNGGDENDKPGDDSDDGDEDENGHSDNPDDDAGSRDEDEEDEDEEDGDEDDS